MKKFLLSCLAVLGLTAGASAETFYTCQFGTGYSESASAYYDKSWTTTVDGLSWTVANMNNNNNVWKYVKLGSNKKAVTSSITCNFVMPQAINEIVVNCAKGGAANSTVTSAKLYSSSTKDFASKTELKDFTAEFNALTSTAADLSLSITEPTKDLYYRLEFETPKYGSNGPFSIYTVKYNAEVVAGDKVNSDIKFPTSFPYLTPGETFTPVIENPNNLPLTFSSENTEIATISETGTITALKAGFTRIHMVYAGSDKYYANQTDIPLNVAQSVNTFADYLAQPEGTVIKYNGTATVVYQKGSNLFLQDATGGFQVFGSVGKTYLEGQTITGFVTTYAMYKNNPQGESPADFPAAEGEEAIVAPLAIAPAELTPTDYNRYVAFNNITPTVTDGKYYAGDVQLYDKFKIGYTLEEGKSYDFKGIYVMFDKTPEMFVLSAEEYVAPATLEMPGVTINGEPFEGELYEFAEGSYPQIQFVVADDVNVKFARIFNTTSEPFWMDWMKGTNVAITGACTLLYYAEKDGVKSDEGAIAFAPKAVTPEIGLPQGVTIDPDNNGTFTFSEFNATEIHVNIADLKGFMGTDNAKPIVVTGGPDGTFELPYLNNGNMKSYIPYSVPAGAFSKPGTYTLTVDISNLSLLNSSFSAMPKIAPFAFTYTISTPSAIEGIDAEEADAVYYDLNGRRVNGTPDAGIYIRVAGDKTTKVIVK